MIYIYCEARSNGARDLVEALDATRLRQFDGMDFWRRGKRVKLQKGDVVICWGRPAPEFEGVMVLNGGVVPSNKLEDLKLFTEQGVPTVSYTTYKNVGFVPRKKFHIGGNDLLNPPTNPDFWVRKYTFTNEYRIHSFDGKSIRAGKKVPRAGYTVVATEEEYHLGRSEGKLVAHPWIRSYDAGWMVDYTDFTSPESMRKLAHKAVESLGLTFGAVDIGEISSFGDIGYLALEVNRAPGIEGNTISTYVKAIQRWIELEPVRQKVEEENRKKLLASPSSIEDHPLKAQLERQEQNRRQEMRIRGSRVFTGAVPAQSELNEVLTGINSLRRAAASFSINEPILSRSFLPEDLLVRDDEDSIDTDYTDEEPEEEYFDPDPIDDDEELNEDTRF